MIANNLALHVFSHYQDLHTENYQIKYSKKFFAISYLLMQKKKNPPLGNWSSKFFFRFWNYLYTLGALPYLKQPMAINTAWKVSVFGAFLLRIFPHSDWIWTRKTTRTDTFYAVKSCQNCQLAVYLARKWILLIWPYAEEYSEFCQTSCKLELFCKNVNRF